MRPAVDENPVSSVPRRTPSSVAPLRGVTDDEAALVERARTERAAFGELYRRHVRAVHGYAYRLTGSAQHAEDITSATFERALRALPSYRWQPGGIRPWLLRIAANEANGWYRQQARHQRPSTQAALRALSDEVALDPAGSVGWDDAPSRRALQAALVGLSDRHREVITLRYLAGLGPDEAAAALGCSKATLAVTLHRAVAALRRALPAQREEAS